MKKQKTLLSQISTKHMVFLTTIVSETLAVRTVVSNKTFTPAELSNIPGKSKDDSREGILSN